MSESCKQCGQGVLVQIQKNTGFCTPTCEVKHTLTLAISELEEDE